MFVVIDRFEGDFAIVQTSDDKMYTIPRPLVNRANEGDVIEITVNETETKRRKESVQNRMKKLWSD